MCGGKYVKYIPGISRVSARLSLPCCTPLPQQLGWCASTGDNKTPFILPCHSKLKEFLLILSTVSFIAFHIMPSWFSFFSKRVFAADIFMIQTSDQHIPDHTHWAASLFQSSSVVGFFFLFDLYFIHRKKKLSEHFPDDYNRKVVCRCSGKIFQGQPDPK